MGPEPDLAVDQILFPKLYVLDVLSVSQKEIIANESTRRYIFFNTHITGWKFLKLTCIQLRRGRDGA